MDFKLNDDQRQLSQSLTRLLDDHGGFEQRRAVAATEPGWSPDLWRRLAELGVTALGIPESCGGLGGSAVDRLPVMQACGRALLLEPYLASAVLGTTAVAAGATAAQKDVLLPRMAGGELLLAWAHDEAPGRHAPLWVETLARRDGNRWQLDGIKACVLHAAAASRLVVSARIHGLADDADGTALFLVDADDPGVRLRSYRLLDDTPAGDLTLSGAIAQPLVDPTDSAHAAAAIRATVSAGTAAVCADMVGTMEL
ncbi:MAG: acyl-CoA dehydrogenase family protein, partial [Burkholderiales bacterium]|nr:acyl-CoA dehydrogenase family protein [Burkholderiales bacterium]